MNIKGKLVEIFDTVQITDTFKKREFKVDLLESLSVGDQINVLINIKGRKWQDKEGNIKYFNSIQGWKIENDNDGVNQDIKEPENSSSDDDIPF